MWMWRTTIPSWVKSPWKRVQEIESGVMSRGEVWRSDWTRNRLGSPRRRNHLVTSLCCLNVDFPCSSTDVRKLLVAATQDWHSLLHNWTKLEQVWNHFSVVIRHLSRSFPNDCEPGEWKAAGWHTFTLFACLVAKPPHSPVVLPVAEYALCL